MIEVVFNKWELECEACQGSTHNLVKLDGECGTDFSICDKCLRELNIKTIDYLDESMDTDKECCNEYEYNKCLDCNHDECLYEKCDIWDEEFTGGNIKMKVLAKLGLGNYYGSVSLCFDGEKHYLCLKNYDGEYGVEISEKLSSIIMQEFKEKKEVIYFGCE